LDESFFFNLREKNEQLIESLELMLENAMKTRTMLELWARTGQKIDDYERTLARSYSSGADVQSLSSMKNELESIKSLKMDSAEKLSDSIKTGGLVRAMALASKTLIDQAEDSLERIVAE